MLNSTPNRPLWQKLIIGFVIIMLLGAFFSGFDKDNENKREQPATNAEIAQNKIPDVSPEFIEGRALELHPHHNKEKNRPDLTYAVKAFERGYKEKNCPYCMAALVKYYVKGYAWFEEKDIHKGIELAKKSYEANCPYGTYALGNLYFKGVKDVIPQDIEKWEKYMVETMTQCAQRDTNKFMSIFGIMAANDIARYYDKKNYKEEAISHYKIMLSFYDTLQDFFKNHDFILDLGNEHDNDIVKYYRFIIPWNIKKVEETITNVEIRPDYVFSNLRPLCMEFADNPIAAGNKYESKSLRVTGQIEEINKDIAGNIYVRFIAPNVIGFITVCCYFGDEQAVESLRRFQYSTIQGIYTDIRANTIILGGCSVINYTR